MAVCSSTQHKYLVKQHERCQPAHPMAYTCVRDDCRILVTDNSAIAGLRRRTRVTDRHVSLSKGRTTERGSRSRWYLCPVVSQGVEMAREAVRCRVRKSMRCGEKSRPIPLTVPHDYTICTQHGGVSHVVRARMDEHGFAGRQS
jgi:hypothetical protein